MRRWLPKGRRRLLLVPIGLVIVIAAFEAGKGNGTGPLGTGQDLTTSTVPTTTSLPAVTATGSTPVSPDDPETKPPPGSVSATVDAVVDGDTIIVRMENGIRERVRLIGINAPEVGECFADEARAVLAELLPVGSIVAMTTDISDRDRFQRLLRHMWVGELHVNAELVRRGVAIAREYRPDVTLADALRDAQREAQNAAAGLWAADACGPEAGHDVRLIELNADAPGNDHENLNGEYVRILNPGAMGVDFTGWVLKDESAIHRYAFPGGFTLAAEVVVTVFTGCGDDAEVELYWCSRQGAVWNNDGDTAVLLDHNGNIVSSLTTRD